MIKLHNLLATAARAATLALLLTLTGIAFCRAQAPAADEARIRAAIVFNLTKFIDWPEWKIGGANAPFVIGIMGSDPIDEEFYNLAREKQVQGKPVVVRHVTTLSQARECHILYLSNSERKRIKELTPDLVKAGVLTIIDGPLASEGIVIGLPLEGSHIGIHVDLRIAQLTGLTMSSRLLGIATVKR